MKLVVADSSYVVEGLLKNASLFENQVIFCPDYSLYEILNAVRKHHVLLKKIKDGASVIDALFTLISTKRIQFLALEEGTIRKSYNLAVRSKMPIYDIVFIMLAKELKIELKTFDKKQATISKNMAHSDKT